MRCRPEGKTVFVNLEGIRLEPNDDAPGTGSDRAAIEIGDGGKLDLINPEREDYLFTGWIGTDVETPQVTVTVPANSTGDRSYIACWEELKYRVDFKTNGGSPVEPQVVRIHGKVKKPADPTRGGFTFAGWYTDKTLKKAYDFKKEVTNDLTLYAKWKQKAAPEPKPKPARAGGLLLARMTASGKSGLTLRWTRVRDAQGYDIFFARCGSSAGYRKAATIEGSKTLKWTKTGLKAKASYKAYVKAWIRKGGRKEYIQTSPHVHMYTADGTKRYTAPKSVTVGKASVTLKKGQTSRIKAKIIKVDRKKKLMPDLHGPQLRYLSSNQKIATVSGGGRITAGSKGTCRIYVYAHNGAYRKVTVTVK